MGTRKAEIPLCFNDLSVVAKTTAKSASWALVIHALVPLRIQSSPSLTAVVEAALASLPFPGSLKAKQPSFCPDAHSVSALAFCSSLPNLRTGSQNKLVFTLMMTPALAHPRLISSHATAYASGSNPAPPYSEGIMMPIRPSSPIVAICSAGKRCSLSC